MDKLITCICNFAIWSMCNQTKNLEIKLGVY